jgi:hypothetical protein
VSASSSNSTPAADSEEQYLHIGDDIAVANTSFGKIRGYQLNGVYTFLGVPYGADTSGKNRFMPPQKPSPWEGVKDTIWWGNTAPQIMDRRYANAHASSSTYGLPPLGMEKNALSWYGYMGEGLQMEMESNRMATTEKILPKKERRSLYPSTIDLDRLDLQTSLE